ARRGWHGRSRQMGRPRHLGRRKPGRTRLSHRIQSLAPPHLERPMKPLVLKPGSVTLAELRAIYEGTLPSLDDSCRERIAAAAGVIQRIVDKGEPVYGINTGFGKLASV